jgi:hypothetical protein
MGEGEAQATSEFNQALELGPKQPEIYPVLLAAALQRNDCEGTREIWSRMVSLRVGTDLDPSQWCGAKANSAPKQTVLRDKILSQYSELRVLVDLARASSSRE